MKKHEFKDLSMKPNASPFVMFNSNEMRPLFRLSWCIFIGVFQEFWKFRKTSQFKHENIWIYGKNFREKRWTTFWTQNKDRFYVDQKSKHSLQTVFNLTFSWKKTPFFETKTMDLQTIQFFGSSFIRNILQNALLKEEK